MHGPLMAKMLNRVETAEGNEIQAILGQMNSIKTQAKIKDDIDPFDDSMVEHLDIFAQFIVPIPLKVYDEVKRSWDPDEFETWEKELIKALGMTEKTRVVGFVRFRRVSKEIHIMVSLTELLVDLNTAPIHVLYFLEKSQCFYYTRYKVNSRSQ